MLLKTTSDNLRKRYSLVFCEIIFCNYIKLFKIQDTSCYNVDVTFISSSRIGLLKFVKFESRHVSSFSCIWKKKTVKFKNTVTFWYNIAYKVNAFALHYIWQSWLIAYKNYSKFCTRKCKKQDCMYCNYHDTSVTYFNSSMVLLRVRNH